MKTTLCLISAAAILCGCQTTSNQTPAQQSQVMAARAGVVAEAAAFAGTQYWLSQHKDDRTYFVASRAALGALLQDPNVTPDKLSSALQGLPVKQLQGEQGTLIVGTAMVLYDSLLQQTVNLDANVYLRPVVSGLYKGLDRALGPQ